MTEATFRSDIGVSLIDFMGSDLSVVRSARVSTLGAASVESQESQGLINFLWREGHHCVDDQTEILTDSGWKFFSDLQGTESVATLNLETDEVEYQVPSSATRGFVDGSMVALKTQHLDLLLTPGHEMLAEPRTRAGYSGDWGKVPASEFHNREYRVRKTGGDWLAHGPDLPNELFALVGFFIGDGNLACGGPDFNIRKPHKLEYLGALAQALGLKTSGGDGRKTHVWASEYDDIFRECLVGGDKVVPRRLLNGSITQLEFLLSGLIASDGHVAANGKITYSTTSEILAGQIQELAMKLGMCADMRVNREAGVHQVFGTDTVCKAGYTVCVFRGRNDKPRVGKTRKTRARDVQNVHYSGEVFCVTVPNGTIYVRRNGKAVWSGNSPFEHNAFTFKVEAPIFTVNQLVRHRIASYNIESGRYRELEPVFYVPSPSRPVVQVGKTGDYQFKEADQDSRISSVVRGTIYGSSEDAWESYEFLLSQGVAKEVARMVLPLNIYSSLYVTMNARTLMNFLRLRNESHAQCEIREMAQRMEVILAEKMPMTYRAFRGIS